MHKPLSTLFLLWIFMLSLSACVKAPAPGRTTFAGLSYALPTTLAGLNRILDRSRKNKKITMVIFYADWEVLSQRFVRDTLSHPKVQTALGDMALVKVDVSKTETGNQAIKHKLGVIGPPAIVFVLPDGVLLKPMNSYFNRVEFQNILDKVEAQYTCEQ